MIEKVKEIINNVAQYTPVNEEKVVAFLQEILETMKWVESLDNDLKNDKIEGLLQHQKLFKALY